MVGTVLHIWNGIHGHISEYGGSSWYNPGAVGLDGIGHMCPYMDVRIRPAVCRTALGTAIRPDLDNILSMTDVHRWANVFAPFLGIYAPMDYRGISAWWCVHKAMFFSLGRHISLMI
jgi:hypothetical protein